MYSWEIQELMELRNYLLSVEEYLHICSTSPQIREVHYNPYEDNFNIKTDDRYDWTFKVKKLGGN
jgi:hypothetical protein